MRPSACNSRGPYGLSRRATTHKYMSHLTGTTCISYFTPEAIHDPGGQRREPSAGSNPNQMKPRAAPAEEGREYRHR